MKLNDKALADFQAHVLRDYPNEACGFIVKGKYIPCKNVSATPETHFEVDSKDYIKALKKGPLEALLHSHPYKEGERLMQPAEWPTTADMESWLAWKMEIPFGIVGTDGVGFTRMAWLDEANPEPLTGREFIHGVNDCFSVIRDWFRQERGITLKNFARGWGWWEMDKNLYVDNFAAAGFEEIDVDDLQVGDVVMLQIGSIQVIHHAAVVVGNNQILHHQWRKLSHVDSLSRWHRCIKKAVRFNPTLLQGDKNENDPL
ncbi:hypothetical protein DBA29_20400 [Xenophilus aerolatus]|nr:hypothetical protein [Xenophilus aerolatus]